jgi:DNA-3-methyladenine glycosylase I
MERCWWADLKSPLYIAYHDEEWGVPSFDDNHLFEMLLLESFQAGLSWLTILNKRENFRKAYNDFDVKKVALYDEKKQEELRNNVGIVRNKLKIKASVVNANVFIEIQKEFGSFSKYIWEFTNGEILYGDGETFYTSSKLSDRVSKDLKKRGMKFVGTTIIYAYLQAVGIVNDHSKNCFLFHKKRI